MQLEVVREVVALLSDPTIGVAAQLAALPVDAEDTAPTAPLVVDGTRDDALVKGEQADRGADALLLVTPDGPTNTTPANIKGEYSNGVTPVAVTIVLSDTQSPAKNVVAAMYVMRAIVCAVEAYFSQRGRNRTRNEVTVLRVRELSYGLVQDDGVGALGAVVFQIQALDKRAQRLV